MCNVCGLATPHTNLCCAQYQVWTLIFQICTMYTAFLDKEISHQSSGRHMGWHWMHHFDVYVVADVMQLILCCSALNCTAAAADNTVTQLTNMQTKTKAEPSLWGPRKASMVWRIYTSVILTCNIKTFLDNDEENCLYYCVHLVQCLKVNFLCPRWLLVYIEIQKKIQRKGFSGSQKYLLFTTST